MVQHQPPADRVGRGMHGQGRFAVGLMADTLLRAFERLHHALLLEGLEQVIEGVHLKGVAHIFIVRRRENQHKRRVHVLYHPCALHAGFAGHFNVKENELGLFLLHKGEQLHAVLRLPHDFKTLCAADHHAFDAPHIGIIVRDDHADWCLHWTFTS